MMKISIPFKNQLESIKIYCKNHAIGGCQEIVTFGDLYKHERECVFEVVPCSYKGCNKRLVRGDLDDHLP